MLSIVQQLRGERGLSRRALAQMAGATSKGIFYIETASASPPSAPYANRRGPSRSL